MVAIASDVQTLTYTTLVNAPIKQVYEAFSTKRGLEEWFCDRAEVGAKPMGQFFLVGWNQGYYSVGTVLEDVEHEKFVFAWHGSSDPAPTEVEVLFKETADGVEVTLHHHQVGMNDEWAATVAGYDANWKSAFENLNSVLEVGDDRRITTLPMVGFFPGPFDAEVAKTLGVPVEEGFLVSGVIPGYSADKAGLQPNDVIVQLDDVKLTGFAEYRPKVQQHQAGDVLKMKFYRGAELHEVDMPLSARPMPDVPPTQAGLAEELDKIYKRLDKDMAAVFEGVTDEEAKHRPAESEWSALETIGHLVGNQRWLIEFMGSVDSGFELSGFGANKHAVARGIASKYETIADALADMTESQEETLAAIRNTPDEVAQHKGHWWRIGTLTLQMYNHNESHFNQMQAAIASAREA